MRYFPKVDFPIPVGYLNKEAAVTGFNYVAPTFVNIGGNHNINLQDIQLDADMGDESADIQILNEAGLYTEFYWWYKKRTDGQVGPKNYRIPCPEGKVGVWFLMEFDEDGEIVNATYAADKTIEWGTGYQLNTEEGAVTTFNGEVTDENVNLAAYCTGFNYFANPYPAEINIQDIQMDAGMGDESADIQILNEAGLYTEFYWWYKKRTGGDVGPKNYRIPCPEGKLGVWFLMEFDEDGEIVNATYAEDKTIAAGDGIQLNTEEGAEFEIVAPYDL